MSLLHLAIVLPFLLAVLIPIIHPWTQRIHAGWLALPLPSALFIYFLTLIPSIRKGQPRSAELSWIPSLGIDFNVYADGLGLLFALLISGIGALVVLYSIYYMDKTKEAVQRFYVFLLLFMGAMLGVVLSDNVMVLYGFWELTSVSSFLLIAFWHKRERSLYGALKSMLITVFGGLCMFVGFILLYVITGTFSIRDMVAQVELMSEHTLMLPAMLLLLLGAFTKSAQFPFHIWLPDAMEAPTPVSSYLHSATMVKAGIYLVARFSPIFAGMSEWFWLVTGFGLMTLIYASFRAIKQTDLKALLAFSTISQLGLIMSLLGLGSAAAFYTGEDSIFYTKATAAAFFHLINHAVFKGALFMVVGNVDHETGTRDIRRLGGLMALMPVTFTVAVVGAFSMAGLPPFGGFLSKEMFFTGVLQIMDMNLWSLHTWGILVPILAWVASIFTFVYSMILVFRTFTGQGHTEQLPKSPHEAPLGMLIPPVILGSLAIIIGLFPNVVSYAILEPVMAAVHPAIISGGGSFAIHISFWHGFTTELFMTMGVVLAGMIVFRLQCRWAPLHQPIFNAWTINHVYDHGLVHMERFSNRFTKGYMTGSIRHYVMYIFVFLIAALGTMLIRTPGLTFDLSGYAPISFYEAIVMIVLVLAAVMTIFAPTRLMAIILTGAAGYIVTLFFVLFRAPDLALTQMIIETVSVTLFLLCFYHLPKLRREKLRIPFKLTNLVISLGVGAVMTIIALGVSGSPLFDSIASYYLQESYNLAGGKNVVNVILVDFRGFDTLLEITVLGIASLAIYALVRLEPSEGLSSVTRPERENSAGMYFAKSNDVILRTVSKFVIFIILTFSLYLFFAGHNAPGGGFIGALMSAAALILLTMGFGMKTMQRILPFDFRSLIGLGLLVALLTGMGSFGFGAAFLSHAFGYFELPLLGKTELATAVLFDLGVYLTVIGVTMTIIFSIGRDE
ncbi:Na+/H+ antiporter subunit A [Paenibacillus massiliensis]|uniref:Na+/H+ antiporter subunit A n=1 Tax=Paenibacillus massiliensis TaxID=225917 RepID=UPI00036B69D5|nr:Na+/H+ antiporter subunit A [Paenibacillus massiliensis]